MPPFEEVRLVFGICEREVHQPSNESANGSIFRKRQMQHSRCAG